MNEITLKIKDKFLIRGRGLLIIPELPVVESAIFTPFERYIELINSSQKNIMFSAKFQLDHFSVLTDDGEIKGELRLVLLVQNASVSDASGSDTVVVDEDTWSLLQGRLTKKN